MFRGKAHDTEQAEYDSAPPEPSYNRPPAAESRIFSQPSTFASRQAETRGNRDRRLVSLGATEFRQRNQRTGETEFLPAELFYDLDKPMERFVSIDGVPGLHPLHSVTGKEDKVTPIPGRIRPRGPSALTPPALPDPPPRPV